MLWASQARSEGVGTRGDAMNHDPTRRTPGTGRPNNRSCSLQTAAAHTRDKFQREWERAREREPLLGGKKR